MGDEVQVLAFPQIDEAGNRRKINHGNEASPDEAEDWCVDFHVIRTDLLRALSAVCNQTDHPPAFSSPHFPGTCPALPAFHPHATFDFHVELIVALFSVYIDFT